MEGDGFLRLNFNTKINFNTVNLWKGIKAYD